MLYYMDFLGLKKLHIRETLKISESDFPRAIAFIDFANVNKWYERDTLDESGNALAHDKYLTVDLQKFANFLNLFCDDVRFYYGTDPKRIGSIKFLGAARHIFGEERVFTKDVQYIRHDLTIEEAKKAPKYIQSDAVGSFIYIPKCNFDVEITLDAIRLMDKFTTFCLLSGDADFAPLNLYLRRHGKKIILIKSGRIQAILGCSVNAKINAQDIKQHISSQKQKPGSCEPGLAES